MTPLWKQNFSLRTHKGLLFTLRYHLITSGHWRHVETQCNTRLNVTYSEVSTIKSPIMHVNTSYSIILAWHIRCFFLHRTLWEAIFRNCLEKGRHLQTTFGRRPKTSLQRCFASWCQLLLQSWNDHKYSQWPWPRRPQWQLWPWIKVLLLQHDDGQVFCEK